MTGTQPLLDDAQGSGWVEEVTPELLPTQGSPVLQGPTAFPGPRASFTPPHRAWTRGERTNSPRTAHRKGKPHWLLPTNLKHHIKRQEPSGQPRLGQEVLLGGEEDEPGAKVDGAGCSPCLNPIKWSKQQGAQEP